MSSPPPDPSPRPRSLILPCLGSGFLLGLGIGALLFGAPLLTAFLGMVIGATTGALIDLSRIPPSS